MTRAGWAIRATTVLTTLAGIVGIVIFADRCRRAAIERGGKW